MLAKSLGIPNNKITVCLLDLSFLGFPARVVLLSCGSRTIIFHDCLHKNCGVHQRRKSLCFFEIIAWLKAISAFLSEKMNVNASRVRVPRLPQKKHNVISGEKWCNIEAETKQ